MVRSADARNRCPNAMWCMESNEIWFDFLNNDNVPHPPSPIVTHVSL